MRRWTTRWAERLRTLFRRRRWEREVEDEMRFHLEMEIRERVAGGMTPAEARRTAHADFGGVERHRERAREGLWTSRAEHLVRDARHASRALLRSPGFTTAAILTLSLAIAAVSTVFSVVHGVLLRPLPYPEPDELFRVHTSWAGQPNGAISPAEFLDYERELDVFSDFGVYSFGAVTVTGDGDPVRVSAAFASAGVLPAFGIRMALGRTFTLEEDRANAPVVVISHGFWRERYAEDPAVIGRTLTWNDLAFEIIGVAAPELRLPEDFPLGSSTQLFVPAGISPDVVSSRGSHFLLGIGRLADGATVEAAARRVEETAARMTDDYPDAYPPDMRFTATVGALRADVVGDVSRLLWTLFGAVAFVLMIGGANVANLLLARAEGRRREIGLRMALGAGRTRIALQLAVESLLLAAVGGALGIGLALLAVDLVPALGPANLPRLDEVRLDGTVLAFSAGVSVLTGLLFGVIPGLQVAPTRLVDTLKDGARALSGSVRTHRVRRALIVGEIAVAVILLAGAGLLARSLASLAGVHPGYRSEQVLTTRVNLPAPRYPTDFARRAFFDELVRGTSGLPGVIQAGAVSNLPLATSLGDLNFRIEGRPVPEGGVSPRADWQVVTPGYFDAIGLEPVAGRVIGPGDHQDAPGVVVVSESLAALHWPTGDALGKRFQLGGEAGPGWVEIVGIVPDIRHASLDAPLVPQMYLAHGQFTMWNGGRALAGMTLVVHSPVPPADLRAAIQAQVARLDPQLPLAGFRTMEEVRSASVALPRLLTVLLASFAALALVLAGVGIYGVAAYSVGRRVPEFGLRLAMGARPAQVSGQVLFESLRLAGLGIALGLGGAFVLTRGLEAFLHGVAPTDPVALLGASLLLGLTGVVATFIPAARATRADPVDALRAD